MKARNVLLLALLICFCGIITNLTALAITASTSGNWYTVGTWNSPATNRTGTITTSTSNTALTGSGTLFLTELSVGSLVRTTGGATIGTIASISSNTLATFTANAASTNTGVNFRAPIPAAADAVTINNKVQVTVDGNATCASILVKTGPGSLNTTNAISISGSYSLSVSGSVTIPVPNNNKHIHINVNDGSMSCGSLTMNGSAANKSNNINVTTGTFTVSGNVTSANTAGCKFNLSGAGTINFSGTFVTNPPTLTTVSGSTVNYDGGAQTILNTAYGNLTLSGSGAKTLPSSSLTINNNFTVSGSANVTASGALSIGGDVDLEGGTFNASSYTHNVAGNWTNNGGTFTASTSTINLNGASAQEIGGSGSNTFNNLTIANSAGVSYAGSVSVSGNLAVTSGYVEMDDQYFQIPNNTIQIAGFAAVTSTATSHMPQQVNRDWTITGTWSTGSVTCRFYWDDADDGNFDWSTYTPSVYKGTEEFTQTAYDVSGSKNWVEVSIAADKDLSKGAYTIGRSDEGTLPVELSSFTAIINSQSMVSIQWVSQSETNLNGYYVNRNASPVLSEAMIVSPLISASNTSNVQLYQFTDTELVDSGTYYYWLQVQEMDGSTEFHGPISVIYNAGGDTGNHNVPPIATGITGIYPNPFNPRVTLSCGMKSNGTVSVQVYNTRGQLVKTLFNGVKDKGNFILQWDGTDELGRNQASGVYIVRMDTASGKSLRKVVLSQ